jgi:hypothetical protein
MLARLCGFGAAPVLWRGPLLITPRRRLVRLGGAFAVVAAVIVIGLGAYVFAQERPEMARTTPRFDPPVWAGQNVPGPCGSGGFYARDGQSIVLTMAGHCVAAKPGASMLDSSGRLVGIFGPPAQVSDCPEGRFCAPSDILALALPPDRIPWGHLNLVDMGAGGYRTIDERTTPLACPDIHVGDRVELDGRERFRTGKVIEIGRYEHTTDTIFPCMVVTDIDGGSGDSGSAVLLNGQPAGMISRVIGRYVAFTPLAEGLASLRLVLCTAPDCGLSPEDVP